MMNICEFLDKSLTAFHAVENVTAMLDENGFEKISIDNPNAGKIRVGGRYYVVRNGSSVVAFSVGQGKSFHICESHTDSPSFKLKGASVLSGGGVNRLNTEKYGGGLLYSFLDRPLKIAGRLLVESERGLEFVSVQSDYNVVIPSLCIHHNPTANDGVAFDLQNDTLPLFSQSAQEVYPTLTNKKVVDADLFAVPATPAFFAGAENEFLCSPRLDNLTSVWASALALIGSSPKNIAVCAMLDNEEIGSGTRQGSPQFLDAVLRFIEHNLDFSPEESAAARNNGMVLSVDNGHALHPAHPEKSDPKMSVRMNGGVVVKHHVNYATDGLSSAIFKSVCARENIPTQDYYNRSNVRCGSTLGLVTSRILQMKTCDIGLAQLAMHSACETVGAKDIETMRLALQTFLNCSINETENGVEIG